jgi:hypothetical protein
MPCNQIQNKTTKLTKGHQQTKLVKSETENSERKICNYITSFHCFLSIKNSRNEMQWKWLQRINTEG